MVKLIICVNRNPDMDVEEFHQFWRTSHDELIKTIPGPRRYVWKCIQDNTVPQVYKRNEAPFDGVAELGFDGTVTSDRFFADPDYLAKVRPDELRFADHTNLVCNPRRAHG